MNNEQTQTAAVSSPAPEKFDIPTDPKANLEWRKTGELAAPTKEAKSKEESTPSKKASADEKPAETAADSASANKQEKTKPTGAAERLNELLADLKKAGLSPAELKTFKREVQQADKAAAGTDPAKAPEKTAQPKLEAPAKPKRDDFESWEKYEDAMEEYREKMTDFKVARAVADDREARAREAREQTLAQKVTEAKARYGEQTEETIGSAVRSILTPDGVSPVVKLMLEESTVLVDMMYTLGSDPAELSSFVELAKSNPGAAIRKIALLEHLIGEELGKAATAKSETTTDKPAETSERAADGKFVAKPAKEKPAAPPPAEELNTRRSAAEDVSEAAVRNHDFRSFKAREDAKDIARRKGA